MLAHPHWELAPPQENPGSATAGRSICLSKMISGDQLSYNSIKNKSFHNGIHFWSSTVLYTNLPGITSCWSVRSAFHIKSQGRRDSDQADIWSLLQWCSSLQKKNPPSHHTDRATFQVIGSTNIIDFCDLVGSKGLNWTFPLSVNTASPVNPKIRPFPLARAFAFKRHSLLHHVCDYCELNHGIHGERDSVIDLQFDIWKKRIKLEGCPHILYFIKTITNVSSWLLKLD